MGTGIAQRSLGGMCARVGGGGVKGCTRKNPHCLPSALVLGLVNGKQPFRIDVFQTRPLNAVHLIRSMCLCIYAGSWLPRAQLACTAACSYPLGCCLFSSPPAEALGPAPRGCDEQLQVDGCTWWYLVSAVLLLHFPLLSASICCCICQVSTGSH